jgi:hypothetical protein
VIVAELMVNGVVPIEVKVSGRAAPLPTFTLPNARLFELTPSIGAAAFSCTAKLLETPPALAFSVTACAVATDFTFPVNPTLVAFAGTVIVEGTVIAALLLAKETANPPLGAAPLKLTVQAAVPAPVKEALLQEKAFNTAATRLVPLREICIVLLVHELLEMVRVPSAGPTAVVSSRTVSVNAWPGFSVVGAESPVCKNPVPVNFAELIVTGKLPLDVNITERAAGVFTITSPNATLAALVVSVRTAALSVKTMLFETPFAVALSVTGRVVVTDEAVAENAALVAPAATFTVAGTPTTVLLLVKLTVRPPLGAAEPSCTVQASVSRPVRLVLLHETLLGVAVPVATADRELQADKTRQNAVKKAPILRFGRGPELSERMLPETWLAPPFVTSA